ncbi:diacylglycerol/lipid kinase family protein [Thermosediminibacter oceani]|uniref:Diacylglycerol kinase catalytic region n=1 Tax=Thermosediminibacter oceani (strain ATCC BAA-1034 / DSM 16646 / JW/IW-1228P) TaxID=555079 RepID=D9S196_THEOJ|nr:diacylglycerol kinase family protein [Thermosediminibacter oceani]ADL08975.1 diacylglycerol kinase catalytic region [Thermosediminibacter oceani DSM 16646]
MKIFFIVNPTAGRKKALAVWESLKPFIDFPYDFALTEGPGKATAIAKEAVKAGYERIVAVGGDGTVREVARALSGTEALLGVIPAGTGNDFVRSAGISQNPQKALETVKNGKVRCIDLIRVDDNCFINVAGAGLDAEVADAINKNMRFLRGAPAYVTGLFKVLATFAPRRAVIEIDGRVLHRKVWLVSVGNARYYGGGMMICPDALLDDGLLDVCIVNSIGRMELLRFLPSVFTGKHKNHPAYEVFRGKKVRVEFERPTKVHADGDVIGTTPVEFSVEPGALKVITGEYNSASFR